MDNQAYDHNSFFPGKQIPGSVEIIHYVLVEF